MPGMGTRYQADEPRYADVLSFPVSRFRMYLVFYRPVAGGIEVLRVLHGARDIHGILAEEFGVEEMPVLMRRRGRTNEWSKRPCGCSISKASAERCRIS